MPTTNTKMREARDCQQQPIFGSEAHDLVHGAFLCTSDDAFSSTHTAGQRLAGAGAMCVEPGCDVRSSHRAAWCIGQEFRSGRTLRSAGLYALFRVYFTAGLCALLYSGVCLAPKCAGTVRARGWVGMSQTHC
jgi:hypothetical protein